jgi:hypothetical protein
VAALACCPLSAQSRRTSCSVTALPPGLHPVPQPAREDDPATLGAAGDLALNPLALGDYQEAHALQQDNLARYRRLLGDNHPETLAAANRFGDVLSGARRI